MMMMMMSSHCLAIYTCTYTRVHMLACLNVCICYVWEQYASTHVTCQLYEFSTVQPLRISIQIRFASIPNLFLLCVFVLYHHPKICLVFHLLAPMKNQASKSGFSYFISADLLLLLTAVRNFIAKISICIHLYAYLAEPRFIVQFGGAYWQPSITFQQKS